MNTAKTVPAEQLAREVDRWLLQHRPEHSTVEEHLRISPTAGGGRIEASVDTESLEWVQVAIDTAADQLGLRDLAWERRRARGLVAVCRHFLDHAHLPARRHGRPTVVVTIDIETLTAATGGSARLDSGAYLTGDAARRLACDAGLVRMITDPASMPLDLGRATRVPSPAQARAVIHRDRHCRYQGCAAPPWACEVHHLDFWAHDGGSTDLDRLGLLCWHHHTLTHRCSISHNLQDCGDGRLRLEPKRRTVQTHAALASFHRLASGGGGRVGVSFVIGAAGRGGQGVGTSKGGARGGGVSTAWWSCAAAPVRGGWSGQER